MAASFASNWPSYSSFISVYEAFISSLAAFNFWRMQFIFSLSSVSELSRTAFSELAFNCWVSTAIFAVWFFSLVLRSSMAASFASNWPSYSSFISVCEAFISFNFWRMQFFFSFASSSELSRTAFSELAFFGGVTLFLLLSTPFGLMFGCTSSSETETILVNLGDTQWK